MEYASSSKATIYPSELHRAFQKEHGLNPGEQHDIHESFTLLCSAGADGMNDILASHFQIGCQYAKTCVECYFREDLQPETLTALLIPVLNGVKHLERSVVNSINNQVSIYCNSYGKVTEHRRSGQFLFLPETLVLVFKRFHQDNRIKKKHSKVELPLELEFLKTLEFPILNHTYTVDIPGWLNDRVLDAYLYILVDAASKNGCHVHAFNTFFFPRLWQIVTKEGSEFRLYEMIIKSRKLIDFESYDYLLIPIHANDVHWTAVIMDIWDKRIYYYDPLGKGFQNETAIKLCKLFFTAFLKWHKTCSIEISPLIWYIARPYRYYTCDIICT